MVYRKRCMSKQASVVGNGASWQVFLPQGEFVVACNIPNIESYDVLSIIDDKCVLWMDKHKWHTNRTIWCTPNIQKVNQRLNLGLETQELYTKQSRKNSGHHAVETLAKKGYDIIHLWGFDSLWSEDLTSAMDYKVPRPTRPDLNRWWRPIWKDIFAKYPQTEFVLHKTKGVVNIEAENLKIHQE